MARRNSSRSCVDDDNMAGSRENFSELIRNPWVIILIAASSGGWSANFFGPAGAVQTSKLDELADKVIACEVYHKEYIRRLDKLEVALANHEDMSDEWRRIIERNTTKIDALLKRSWHED
ncbi:MAG: hypothetical protein R3260_16055 [Pseudomonas sp.]|nr:hypothetical protein [Pseudomonas sp.]